ncbi:MAG: prepilin-type N-terminal cleavage/methylation domain-containing protein, partial [Candidatus Wildermuthbacteria bacterium]|nr:prepilin-type N-terminal cleavage/methylation domain-containing protein [Candidatus Wildermuthbacteria bacterium]
MRQNGNERNEPKGFTLIELLVASFLFSFLSGIAVNFVLSGIDAQRNVLSQQTLSSQMSYVAEYMSRALRQAGKELRNPPQCLGRYGTNYDIRANGTAVAFIGRQGQQTVCREFFLESGILKERIAGGVAESLTPA